MNPPDPLWPDWLREIWGPAPGGPRRRTEALRRDAEHKREIDARLKVITPPVPRPPAARRNAEATAEELRQARIALGLEPPDPPPYAEAAE